MIIAVLALIGAVIGMAGLAALIVVAGFSIGWICCGLVSHEPLGELVRECPAGRLIKLADPRRKMIIHEPPRELTPTEANRFYSIDDGGRWVVHCFEHPDFRARSEEMDALDDVWRDHLACEHGVREVVRQIGSPPGRIVSVEPARTTRIVVPGRGWVDVCKAIPQGPADNLGRAIGSLCDANRWSLLYPPLHTMIAEYMQMDPAALTWHSTEGSDWKIHDNVINPPPSRNVVEQLKGEGYRQALDGSWVKIVDEHWGIAAEDEPTDEQLLYPELGKPGGGSWQLRSDFDG